MTSNYFTYFQLANQPPPRWVAHSAFGGGGGLTPANHQPPSQAAHSLPSPPEWRENRWKVRRLVDGDKESLTGKAKGVCASKAETGIHSWLPISRQVCPATPWQGVGEGRAGSRKPSHCANTLSRSQKIHMVSTLFLGTNPKQHHRAAMKNATSIPARLRAAGGLAACPWSLSPVKRKYTTQHKTQADYWKSRTKDYYGENTTTVYTLYIELYTPTFIQS